MNAIGTFYTALVMLQDHFAELPGSTRDKAAFRIDGQVGCVVRKNEEGFVCVALAWEDRPGVWFAMGDMEDAVRKPALFKMGVGYSGARNDANCSNADVLAYAQHLCKYAAV